MNNIEFQNRALDLLEAILKKLESSSDNDVDVHVNNSRWQVAVNVNVFSILKNKDQPTIEKENTEDDFYIF